MSPTWAGERLEIWMATNPGSSWTAFRKVTTRLVDAAGAAYSWYRSPSSQWLAVRPNSPCNTGHRAGHLTDAARALHPCAGARNLGDHDRTQAPRRVEATRVPAFGGYSTDGGLLVGVSLPRTAPSGLPEPALPYWQAESGPAPVEKTTSSTATAPL